MYQVHAVPLEAGRRCQISWNWSYSWLWVAMWVLGNEPRSSLRTASALTIEPCLQPQPLPILKTKTFLPVTFTIGFCLWNSGRKLYTHTKKMPTEAGCLGSPSWEERKWRVEQAPECPVRPRPFSPHVFMVTLEAVADMSTQQTQGHLSEPESCMVRRWTHSQSTQ